MVSSFDTRDETGAVGEPPTAIEANQRVQNSMAVSDTKPLRQIFAESAVHTSAGAQGIDFTSASALGIYASKQQLSSDNKPACQLAAQDNRSTVGVS